MAQVAKKNNDLAMKYSKFKKISLIGYIVCFGSFIGFGIAAMNFAFDICFPLMLPFLGGGLVGGMMKQKADAAFSGIVGENATADIIRALPEYYCGFQNLKITFDGKTSELDMVVVGPTGVFIIETKNMGGTIVGNYDNPQWSQNKIGQQGTPYSSSFYSPIKQVGTHVYRLANYLRSNGINVNVESMVYFSNPATAIQLLGNPSKTPVFSALANGSTDIHNFILTNQQQLTQEEIVKIVTLLNR